MIGSDLEFAFIGQCLRRPELFGYGVRPVDPLAQWLLDKIYEFRDKYNQYPTLDTILRYIRPYCEAQEYELIEKELKSDVNAEFVVKEVVKFAEYQKLRRAIHEASGLLEDGKIQEARAALSEGLTVTHSPPLDYFSGKRPMEYHEPMPTGYVNLDKALGGGLGRRKLGLVLGPRSSGKSMVLLNFGVGALYHGLKVFHITLEDSLASLVKRYDIRLKGFGNKPIDRVKKLFGGELYIKEFMTGEATVSDFAAYMDIQPDMVLVDYLDTVKSSQGYKQRRHELGDVAKGLRALAQRFNCAVWTAKQTGRSTKFSSDMATAEDTFESYEPVQVADVAVVINQTQEEREDGVMRLLLDKNKDGPDGKSLLFEVDYSRMLLRVPR